MKAFYLLKPDLINNGYIKYYLDTIKSKSFIKINNFYYIDDWVSLSKELYDKEYDENISEYRRKILITILGYYKYYKNEGAIINFIDVSPENLNELEKIKKDFRRKYVYNREKYYVKIENDSMINYNESINKYDLSLVQADYYYDVLNLMPRESYNLIFFNKIHCPDPTEKSINRDIEIIEKRKLKKITL